ncbi:SCO2322 family protein [Streptomyces bathyalis]|uniref:SCO2322 family protein n=1 Tax=Streptomyces bathyalis TaxID=2710756 RepID=UPI001FE668BD|nr:SCO2322 family protein [Streptomyces bathyalis]
MIGLALLPATVQVPASAADVQATKATTTAAAPAAVTARTSGSGSYRYWAFWERKGKDGNAAWSYATQGPSVLRPEDGAVLGFRFALSEDSKDAEKPRGEAEFAAVCGGTEAERGRKRIALAIDFGTPAHAPRGESPPRRRTTCAQVDEDATAADALADVAKPLRYNSDALLCAIDGYPERGCGEQIESGDDDKGTGQDDTPEDNGAGAEDDAGDDSSNGFGSATGVAAGLAAVAALSFATVRRSRRRG